MIRGKPASARTGRPSGLSPALLLSGAVVCLALPSAVLAFSSGFDGRPQPAAESAGSLAVLPPTTASPLLARPMTVPGLTRGQLFRFTPAGNTTRPDRSVTVAVRVDPQAAGDITVRAPSGVLGNGLGRLRIAPTAYSLGVSRGFQNFVIPGELRRTDMPDLAAFKLGPKASSGTDEPSRLAARLALDQREKTGRAPRTLEASGEQTVDFGGSYRLTRNIDVTAGVRYSQDRDRLVTVVPDGQKDAQAVYVGTQFRF
ncbi:hypothetical protein ACFOON_17180 [Novosphingobium piscinae]|uniref:Porin domain-containing protein n=1 Tax=Novosphingobium piscinae TaxID=1507448 RepID=A0A7X1KR24_9SPHN|nr:hypothetical protein [Novosphingobium piscinae]MBC2670334.1 hypothetical protein [Novosphingobium piscinae]